MSSYYWEFWRMWKDRTFTWACWINHLLTCKRHQKASYTHSDWLKPTARHEKASCTRSDWLKPTGLSSSFIRRVRSCVPASVHSQFRHCVCHRLRHRSCGGGCYCCCCSCGGFQLTTLLVILSYCILTDTFYKVRRLSVCDPSIYYPVIWASISRLRMTSHIYADIFRASVNSLVCLFCTVARLGLVLFYTVMQGA